MTNPTVAVLAPYRSDGGRRDELWAFARQRWASDFPQWPIFEGSGPASGPFNRSAAINQAAELAGDWDVAVIIDTDILANQIALTNAVRVAHSTDQMVVSHNERIMLNRNGTTKVMNGYTGNWRAANMVERVWGDSVSCAVIVSRKLWDAVGGFDEMFNGWGYEDTAFRIACEAKSGQQIIVLASELYHLWHPTSLEAKRGSQTLGANAERVRRYEAARWNEAEIDVLLAEAAVFTAVGPLPETRIPRILHRTVPADTTEEVEGWWRRFQALHPGWEFRTYREPIDPKDWPLTGDLFRRCQNGAQKAGLIRLEALVTHGGIYVDSDVEPFRSMEPLLQLEAFAAWEDETTVPDAVLGAMPQHPAFVEMVAKARSSIEGGGDAWLSGPGVTTATLPGRHDVLLLPPGSVYPFHYLEKAKRASVSASPPPYAFCAHQWHHSWGSPAQKRSIESRQRA